jgi:biotin synthase-related radical SAM superfamily protein
MTMEEIPGKIRISVGSAIVLDLSEGWLDALPTTIYLLTYKRGKCSASCAFCPQSKISSGRADMLSRVIWPEFPTDKVVERIAKAYKKGNIQRVCIQALNYSKVQKDLLNITSSIRATCEIPISVSCQPLSQKRIQVLAEAGVNRISVALDAATEELFDKVKGSSAGGPYRWKNHLKSLVEAVQVFGRNNVSTHLIAGLGEQEEDFVKLIQKCVDMGVYPAVFAFTPVPGTIMEHKSPPPIETYRKLQLAQYLITHGLTRYEKMRFEKGYLIDFGLQKTNLIKVVKFGEPFRTSGCPGCNRPYYNERPGGIIYNYPKELAEKEIADIKKVLCL